MTAAIVVLLEYSLHSNKIKLAKGKEGRAELYQPARVQRVKAHFNFSRDSNTFSQLKHSSIHSFIISLFPPSKGLHKLQYKIICHTIHN